MENLRKFVIVCSNVRTFRCSNLQMFEHLRCSNIQMFEHSDVRTFRCSNIQMCRCRCRCRPAGRPAGRPVSATATARSSLNRGLNGALNRSLNGSGFNVWGHSLVGFRLEFDRICPWPLSDIEIETRIPTPYRSYTPHKESCESLIRLL